MVQLLENPELIRLEIKRRIKQIQDSSPTKRRKDAVEKEIARISKSIEKLLDAYQEGLIQLEELRRRMPGLRKRQEALKGELNSLEASAISGQEFLRVAENMEDFLGRLRKKADSMSVSDRQKIVRLLVKEILVDLKTIKIRHSIPVSEVSFGSGPENSPKIGYIRISQLTNISTCVHRYDFPHRRGPRYPGANSFKISHIVN